MLGGLNGTDGEDNEDDKTIGRGRNKQEADSHWKQSSGKPLDKQAANASAGPVYFAPKSKDEAKSESRSSAAVPLTSSPQPSVALLWTTK